MRDAWRTRMARLVGCLAVASMAWSATPQDRADDPIVPAAQAAEHIGERRTVELTVRASKNSMHHREYYLDSEKDFHDPKNFAVVVSYDDLKAFQDAGVEDPSEHYRGKTIQVTGKILREEKQARIRATSPKHIRILEEKKPSESEPARRPPAEDNRP